MRSDTEPRHVTVAVPLRREIDESYPIVIGTGLAAAVVDHLTAPGLAAYRPVIITDDTVRAQMAEAIRLELEQRGIQAPVLSFPPGEVHKTRATKEALEDALIDAGYGRDTCVVAVGGGVVTDLAGFVAATFTRGVPLVNVPTTILAAADASVGGKTGLDTPAATNLIGAFHQPVAVYIDLATWRTLPDEHVRTGLAETIKHACLADAEFFALLERTFVTESRTLQDVTHDSGLCALIAQRNCEIKRDVVVRDVHEADVRMALNLGHTFGRALETAADYTISHGQGVAIGVSLQARWGRELGFVSDVDVDRVLHLFAAVGLPTALPTHTSIDRLLDAMTHDKKALGGAIRFVFQNGIGQVQTFADGGVVRAADRAEITAFLVRART